METKSFSTMATLLTCLVIYGMVSQISALNGCGDDTRTGFFDYDHTDIIGFFGQNHYQDNDPNYGDCKDDFEPNNEFAIFNAEFSKFKVCDYGVVFPNIRSTDLYETSHETPPTDETASFDDEDHSYIAQYWMADDNNGYKFVVDHLDEDTMNDGLNIGPRYCDLRRIELMINRCDEDPDMLYTTRGKIHIKEAFIITWLVDDGDDMVFQTVIAYGVDLDNNNRPNTFVIMINTMDMPSGQTLDAALPRPIVNGRYTANSEYAMPCSPATGTWKDYSNCRCARFLTGVYVFAVRDNDLAVDGKSWKKNVCTGNKVAFEATCQDNSVRTRQKFQHNCRPSETPQDSCIDEVTCSTVKGSDTYWKMEFSFKYIGELRRFNFINEHHAISDDTSCVGDIAVANDVGTLTKTVPADDLGCYLIADGDKLKGGLRLYESEVHKDYTYNARYLYFICTPNDLPYRLTTDIEGGDIFHEEETTYNRTLTAYWGFSRAFDTSNEEQARIPPNTALSYASHVYLSIALNYEDIKEYVQGYAVYVEHCWVSNNPTFSDSGDDKMMQIVTDGCNTQTKVFSFEDEFVGQFLDVDLGNGINFVTTSGRMEAHKWNTATDRNTLYFRCQLGNCFNPDIYLESRCYKSCTNNETVDFISTRKRRDDQDEKLIVETSITFLDPQGDVDAQVTCVTSTIAISTLVALLVILIMSMLVTLMLFMKLRARQKK